MHAPDWRESRRGSPRQGFAARFRGFARNCRSGVRTPMVQSTLSGNRKESFWCIRAILHFFGERVCGARVTLRTDIGRQAAR
jgi:hypothetical protein